MLVDSHYRKIIKNLKDYYGITDISYLYISSVGPLGLRASDNKVGTLQEMDHSR